MSNHCGSPCGNANVIYESPCPDPGSAVSLRHLSGLDASFCPRRLGNAAGFLVAMQTGSGWQIGFTTAPNVPFGEVNAVVGQSFGRFLVQGSDGVLRVMNGPVVANRFLGTNATGDVIFQQLPSATIPDPLTVTTLNATNLNVSGPATFTGSVALAGLGAGTIVSQIGLDSGNNLVIGTGATIGVQTCCFYENPTSPGATSPNAAVMPGGLLTIGNLLFDSVLPAVPGGALITALNSQTLQVVTAGTYELDFCGQVTATGVTAFINLLINGIAVNTGNASGLAAQTTVQRIQNISGFDCMRLAAGTAIQLQLGNSGTTPATYAVRFRATRTGP